MNPPTPNSDPQADILGLEPLPTAHLRPSLPGGAAVLKATADEAYDAAAADLLIQASNCVRVFGDFHLAVSAAASAEPFLARLMWDPQMRDLPWGRTHLWIAEADHARDASESIRALLVDHSDLPPSQFHALPYTPPAYAGDDATLAAYETTLRETLGWRERGHDRLDHVLLALDPASPLLRPLLAPPEGALVVPATNGGMGVGAMFTLSVLNAARFIGVVGVGQKAAKDLSAAWRAVPAANRLTPDPSLSLALRLKPHAGELRWYLDAESLA